MKSRKKGKWLISGLLLASLIVLSACGADNKTATSEEDQTYHLSVGYLKANGAPLADLAKAEGFFESENLEVDLVPFSASTDGINALQSRKIDIGLTFGTTTPLAFIAQGADLDIIGGHMEGGHPIFVKEGDKDKYKSFEDYKGATIGTVRLSVPDILFKSALTDAGVDIEKDVKFVEFKNMAGLLEATISNKVDIAFAGTGHLTKAIKGGLTPIAWSNDVQPGHVCCRVVTTGELVEEEREALKRFMKGLIQAERVKLESPEKALEATKVHFKLDEETVNEIVNEEHLINSADPHKKEVVKLWEQMKELDYLSNGENVDINKHINITIFEEAINELIKENPDDQYFQDTLERYYQQNQ